jgi:hypothetical protein
MARLATVGFETGGVETNGAYTQTIPAIGPDYARTGNYGMSIASAGFWSFNFGQNLTELYGRIAIRIAAAGLVNDNSSFITFRNSVGATIGYLMYDGDLQQFKFSLNGTDILAMGNIGMQGNRWYVLEFYFKVNASGQFVLKIDGVTDFSYSGNTGATNIRTFWLMGPASVNAWWMDDIALNDATGSFENSYPGLGGIFFLKPNGDGAQSDFTPSEGSDHYALVDDVPANTTDYLQGLNGGEQELFDIEDTPEYVTTINVVQPIFQAAVSVSGSNVLRDIVYDGVSIYPGDASQPVVSIEPDYVFYWGKVYYEQPDGVSGAFDPTALDALQVGFEIPT